MPKTDAFPGDFEPHTVFDVRINLKSKGPVCVTIDWADGVQGAWVGFRAVENRPERLDLWSDLGRLRGSIQRK